MHSSIVSVVAHTTKPLHQAHLFTMPQDNTLFPSLDQILDNHLRGFPRDKLLRVDVDDVRQVLWELVQQECLTTTQYMRAWHEYAHDKKLDLNQGEYYYGVDKETFAEATEDEIKSLSLQGLDNGLLQHLKLMELWDQACLDGIEVQENDSTITNEPHESEEEEEVVVDNFTIVATRRRASNEEDDNATANSEETVEDSACSKLALPNVRAEKPSAAARGSPSLQNRRGRPRKHSLPENQEPASSSQQPPRKRGRPRKHPLPETEKEIGSMQPPRKRGRPRKHPLPEAEEETPPQRKRGRPRKHPLPEAGEETAPLPRQRGRPRKHPLPEAGEETALLPPPRRRGRPRKNPLPAKVEAESSTRSSLPPRKRDWLKKDQPLLAEEEKEELEEEEQVFDKSAAGQMLTRKTIKPKQYFDPCAEHGRYWSESGPVRKRPSHDLMQTTSGEKKSNRIFNIEKRAMTLGDFQPQSLWKYVNPKDKRAYIVEIANNKGVKNGKIEVLFKGYGSAKHRVDASKVEVPSDEDFQMYEANVRHARLLASKGHSQQCAKMPRKSK